MSGNRRTVEAKGQNVEAAVESGLAQLGLTREQVIIDVIDEGSRGLLGIGSRDAVVRLTELLIPAESLKATKKEEVAPPTPKPPLEEKPEKKPKPQPATAVTPPKPIPPEPKLEPEPEPEPEPEEPKSEPAPVPDKEKTVPTSAEEEKKEETEVAVEFVTELLEKMHIEADVSTRLSKPDDLTGKQIPVIDIEGKDLGVLIGPRGETLNAVQYVCRLMVGHKMRQRTEFVLDVEGYRQRREKALARLAERMASKVMKRGRPISLEPMPPHERRIIHMTLRDYDEVYTQSVGEGKRRKVRVIPSKK